MAKTKMNAQNPLIPKLIIAIPAALGLICLLVASVFGIVKSVIDLVNIFSNFGGIYSVTNLIKVLTGLLKDLIAFLPYVLAAAFALFYGKKKEGFWQGMAFGAAALTFLMAIIAWPLQNLSMVFSDTIFNALKAFGKQIPGMLLDLLRAILFAGTAFLAVKKIKKNNIPLFLIPLAIAIPAAGREPFVLDMATSVVARGKVALAAKEGRSIPEGWAIDENGKPTTDPGAVKCVLPFGGPKGYGIALMIEVLCSCLSGAKTGTTMGSFYDFSGKKQDSGFFVGAINVGIMDSFEEAADQLFGAIKNSPRADGVAEIFIPGEIERRNYERAEKEGIELSDPIVAELEALAQATGVPLT